MSEEQKALSEVLNGSAQEKAPSEEVQEEASPAEAQVEEPEEEKEEEAPAAEEPAEEAKDEQEKEEPREEAKEEQEQEKEEAQEEKKPEEPKNEEKKEARKEAPKAAKKRLDENVVLVGKKPTMSYVLAAVTQFSDGMNEIHIKARGRSISRAVDVAEVIRNRFVQGAKADISIGTQEITDDNNNKINVSTIDIALKK